MLFANSVNIWYLNFRRNGQRYRHLLALFAVVHRSNNEGTTLLDYAIVMQVGVYIFDLCLRACGTDLTGYSFALNEKRLKTTVSFVL